MTDEKKMTVDLEVFTKIKGWIDEGKTVGRYVCQDLGCVAVWFSPEKLVHCQRHAWACPVRLDREIEIDELEVAPPTPGHKAGTPYKWEIINLDVWGNGDDGWEVNQAFHTRKMIELPEEFTDKDVRDALVADGYLKKTCQTRHLEIDGDDMVIYVNQAKDDRPILQLFREDR